MDDNTLLNSIVDADEGQHKFEEESSLLPPCVQYNQASHGCNIIHTSDGHVPEGYSFKALFVDPHICTGLNCTYIANYSIISCYRYDFSFVQFLMAIVEEQDDIKHL